MTEYDVEDIFDGTSSPDKFRLTGDAVIVHGTDGKPIRARNKTQEELVKAYFDNDLVFAVGPAGTGKTYIAIALAVRASPPCPWWPTATTRKPRPPRTRNFLRHRRSPKRTTTKLTL